MVLAGQWCRLVANLCKTITRCQSGLYVRLRISSFSRLPASCNPFTILCKDGGSSRGPRAAQTGGDPGADVVGYSRLMGQDESGTLAPP